MKRSILKFLLFLGINPGVARVTLRNYPRYLREERAFKAMMVDGGIPMGPRYPVLHDYEDNAGSASGHYFHMDLWAARRIYQASPQHHVDIGSRIDGFIAHLLAFRTVEVLDIRPLHSEIDGLTFIQDDATSLSGIDDGVWASISCLHAAEHFGLGRYGDPIDPLGYRKLLQSLARVLAKGGRLYFAVPIGRERVEFNAHRVFDPVRIVSEFAPLKLVAFGAVDDQGRYVPNAAPEDFQKSEHACGLYEFTKL